jgi:hypothetical protein
MKTSCEEQNRGLFLKTHCLDVFKDQLSLKVSKINVHTICVYVR